MNKKPVHCILGILVKGIVHFFKDHRRNIWTALQPVPCIALESRRAFENTCSQFEKPAVLFSGTVTN